MIGRILLLAAIVLLVFAVWRTLKARRDRAAPAPLVSIPAATEAAPGLPYIDADPPYSDEIIEAIFDNVFKIAFGTRRFDYRISGDHAAVLGRVTDAAAEAVHRREYFPRRPMLLPRLLQALNDDESSQRRIAALILEDPALAGNVLQAANNAFYRLSSEPVDSIDRAVAMLGTDGMRRLLATALLQPVFRLPSGYFESFAPTTWEQAQRTAAAAAAYAQSSGKADPFAAQLLGLLSALARIVIFRLTMEMYREQPNLLPRAEVFIRSMQARGPQVARLIAASWELPAASLQALDEQISRPSPLRISPLGQAVYYGELCGALALLDQRGVHSGEGARALLQQQGAAPDRIDAMWSAADAREPMRQ